MKVTLCKSCHDKFYPDSKLPEILGIASYTATGYCKHCGKRSNVKRYEIQEVQK
ncbi:MAG TPA: hypothetical protein VIK78_14585 [Ruminiclostridium sp.]